MTTNSATFNLQDLPDAENHSENKNSQHENAYS